MTGTGARKLNILMLCSDAAKKTGTTRDHISAFENLSKHRVLAIDSIVAGLADIDINLFDAVVFHYSIVISMTNFLSEEFLDRLSGFQGPKILFIQDEFRWVNRTMATAERIGINTVFTVVNKEVIRKIYRNPYFDTVQFEQTLTGFVPENLVTLDVPPIEARNLDVVYRARKLPAWCGSFAQQKWEIAEKFEQGAKKFGLKTDIATSEESRIYGSDWIKFLSNAKATLGTESGASFVDFEGDVIPAVNEYEATYPEAKFEDVRDRFLQGRDGEITINVISPRVFEAAALRTLMILYPGSYSDILVAGRHYVELKYDHSNMTEVANLLKDTGKIQKIIDTAYEEIASSDRWTFGSFMKNFDVVVSKSYARLSPVGSSQTLQSDENLINDVTEEIERSIVAIAVKKRQLERRVRRYRRLNFIWQIVAKILQIIVRVLNAILPKSASKLIKKRGRKIILSIKSAILGRDNV